MKISYHLPGLFEFYDLYCIFLQLYQKKSGSFGEVKLPDKIFIIKSYAFTGVPFFGMIASTS